MTEEFEYKPGEITIDDPRLNGESLSPYRKMVRAVILGHGTICVSSNITEVSIWSKENLSVPELKEVDDEPFNPTVANLLSPLLSGVETGTAEEGTQNKLTVQLGGFFGVKLRTGADMVLSGDYSVPLYVQWKYLKTITAKVVWSAALCATSTAESGPVNLCRTQTVRHFCSTWSEILCRRKASVPRFCTVR